jgi:hypothetical protein
MLLVGHNQYGCDGKPYRGPDFHAVTKTLHDEENVSRVAVAVKAKDLTLRNEMTQLARPLSTPPPGWPQRISPKENSDANSQEANLLPNR